MSRKIRYLRKMMRHLRRHPKDSVALKIVNSLKEGRYRWDGRKLKIITEETE